MVNWITVYTTSAFECKYCIRLKELLKIYGYDFYEKDISKEERYREEFLERGFRAVPQVYIEDALIGGYDMTKKYFRNHFFNDHPNRAKILKELEELE